MRYTVIMFGKGYNPKFRYFSSPCRCCGMKDHSMMTETEEQGQVSVGYGCPIVETEDGVDVNEQWKQRRIKYRPCPVKFAELHHFSRQHILEALATFRMYGDGRHVWMDEYQLFSDTAVRKGEVVRSSWTFKRTDPRVALEDEDSTDDEDQYF